MGHLCSIYILRQRIRQQDGRMGPQKTPLGILVNDQECSTGCELGFFLPSRA